MSQSAVVPLSAIPRRNQACGGVPQLSAYSRMFPTRQSSVKYGLHSGDVIRLRGPMPLVASAPALCIRRTVVIPSVFVACTLFATGVLGQDPTSRGRSETSGSTDLSQKALGTLSQKRQARDITDRLLQGIRDNGHEVIFDEPEIHASLRRPETVDMVIPVSIRASDTIKEELEEVARSLDGLVKPASYERRMGAIIQIAQDPDILEYFHRRIAGLVFVTRLILDDETVYQCFDDDEARNHLRNPIAPVRLMWSKPRENRVVGLGVNPGLHKGISPSDARNGIRDRGSVMVFDDAITFHVTFTLPVEVADNIQAIEGKFVQWKLTDLDAYNIDRTVLGMRAACQISPPDR
jgi:hypothetical protein